MPVHSLSNNAPQEVDPYEVLSIAQEPEPKKKPRYTKEMHDRAVEHIAEHEGYSEYGYTLKRGDKEDKTAEDFPTIGFGHYLDGSPRSREIWKSVFPNADYNGIQQKARENVRLKKAGKKQEVLLPRSEGYKLLNEDQDVRRKEVEKYFPEIYDKRFTADERDMMYGLWYQGSFAGSKFTRRRIKAALNGEKGQWEAAANEFLKRSDYAVKENSTVMPGTDKRYTKFAEMLLNKENKADRKTNLDVYIRNNIRPIMSKKKGSKSWTYTWPDTIKSEGAASATPFLIGMAYKGPGGYRFPDTVEEILAHKPGTLKKPSNVRETRVRLDLDVAEKLGEAHLNTPDEILDRAKADRLNPEKADKEFRSIGRRSSSGNIPEKKLSAEVISELEANRVPGDFRNKFYVKSEVQHLAARSRYHNQLITDAEGWIKGFDRQHHTWSDTPLSLKEIHKIERELIDIGREQLPGFIKHLRGGEKNFGQSARGRMLAAEEMERILEEGGPIGRFLEEKLELESHFPDPDAPKFSKKRVKKLEDFLHRPLRTAIAWKDELPKTKDIQVRKPGKAYWSFDEEVRFPKPSIAQGQQFEESMRNKPKLREARPMTRRERKAELTRMEQLGGDLVESYDTPWQSRLRRAGIFAKNIPKALGGPAGISFEAVTALGPGGMFDPVGRTRRGLQEEMAKVSYQRRLIYEEGTAETPIPGDPGTLGNEGGERAYERAKLKRAQRSFHARPGTFTLFDLFK